MPETEWRPAVTVGHGNLQQLPMRGGLSNVAVRTQTIWDDRGTDEAGTIVNRLQIDERRDAAVDAVTAARQRGDGVAAEAIPTGAKHGGSECECLFERRREMLELGQLQLGWQVLEHRVAGNERLGEGRGVPRVQVGGDLPAAVVRDLPQDACRLWISGDLIRREVGRPNPQSIEERGQPTQLADVLHRHIVTAAVPVVLLGVDGHDDQDVVRARIATLTHRPAPASRLARDRPRSSPGTLPPHPARAATGLPPGPSPPTARSPPHWSCARPMSIAACSDRRRAES